MTSTLKVWRGPVAPMILSAFGAVFIGALALFLAAVAVGLPAVTRIFIPFAVLMLLMAVYVARDALGKRPWRIEVGPEGLRLDMPAGRSLIHNPPAIKRTIAIADIAAVQARDEAYKGLLSAQVHRAYRLLLKDGSGVFLFEERGLGTSIATPSLNPIATDLAAHLGAPFTDLGMAQGINGLFGVVLARAPEWGAPALSPEVRGRLWTRVQLTGLFALAAMAIAVLLMILL